MSATYKSKVVIPLTGKSDTVILYTGRGHRIFHIADRRNPYKCKKDSSRQPAL
ncbi:MAG: hypothetical protein AB2L14_33300 [Candidatus Xenobiia bacterium LiM19]